MTNYKIIFDGSNGAFSRRSHRKEAKIENLKIIIEYLEDLKRKYSIDYEIVTDASLRYRIDDKSELEQLYKTGKIIQCPKGIKADDFIIEYFRKHPENTIILSNDNFSEYTDVNPRVYKFVIMFNEIIIQPDITEIFRSFSITKEGSNVNAQAI